MTVLDAPPPVPPAPTPPATDAIQAPPPPPPPAATAATQPPGARIGRFLVGLGTVLVLFLVYELTVATIPQQRAQRQLVSEFELALQAAAAEAADAAAGGAADEESGLLTAEAAAGEATTDEATFDPAPEGPGTGDPVALLQIASIGLEQIVVEGTGGNELRDGPGHYRNTPMPGQAGNAAIAGARTSKGAPFRHLDQLETGDEIVATTPQGSFTYVVSERRTLTSEDPDPVQPLRENRLTLVTSTPAFRGTERLVVVADLQGRPVARPPGWFPTAGREDETGFTTTPGAFPWTVLWASVLVVALILTARIYQSWRFWPAWVVSTPILLLVLVQLYTAAAGLLPATF